MTGAPSDKLSMPFITRTTYIKHINAVKMVRCGIAEWKI